MFPAVETAGTAGFSESSLPACVARIYLISGRLVVALLQHLMPVPGARYSLFVNIALQQ